jgi:hypothetical protein
MAANAVHSGAMHDVLTSPLLQTLQASMQAGQANPGSVNYLYRI